MFIRSLYIESFAGITGKGLELSKGLNVIEGANESGKSTVCMFIKFMLYGLSGRGSDGEMSERQKYLPWDTGHAAGTLVIATAKGEYKITRELLCFDDSQPRERLEVIDTESGERVFRGKVPGVCILGIDEQMFVNTVFVRQIGGTKVDGAGMTEAIENILLSGDENLSLKRAVDRLDKARKALAPKKGSGGRIPLLLQEEARLAGKLEEARAGNAAVIAYENEASRLASLIKQRTEERDKYTSLCIAYEKIEMGRRAEEARELLSHSRNVKEKLLSIERYGSISDKSGRINSLSARLSGIISRLKGLRRAMGDAPDDKNKMTGEEILSAKRDIADAKKLSGTVRLNFVLFAALAILGAVGSVFFIFAAALLAPAIVFFVLGLVNCAKKNKIYKKWSVKNDSNLEEEVTDAIERAKEYDRAADEWSRREHELFEVEREREEVLSSLREACLVFAKENDTDTDLLVSEALEKASALIKEKEELSASYAMIKGELRGYASLLGEDEGESVLEMAKEVRLTDAGRIAAEYSEKDAAMARNKKNFAEGALPGLLSQKGEADAALARARATTLDAAVLAVQLEGTRQEIATLKKRLAAIEEAKDALTRAGEGLRSSLVPRVVGEASDIMEGFTDGKYDSLSVDRTFALEFLCDGKKREVGYLSAGTADAAYISLRCALARVLFSGDVPPLVYDESFARIDEERLFEILSLLSRDDMQSLVFTCRRLEGDIAKKLSGAARIKL